MAKGGGGGENDLNLEPKKCGGVLVGVASVSAPDHDRALGAANMCKLVREQKLLPLRVPTPPESRA
jgi:hypothetical protein